MPQNRTGLTKVTSVTITKEMQDFIEKHNISPTEAMRVGLGIIKYELGYQEATSPLNQKRAKLLKELEKEAKKKKEMMESYRKIKKYVRRLNSLLTKFESVLGKNEEKK